MAIHDRLEDKGSKYGIAEPDWVRMAIAGEAEHPAPAENAEAALVIVAFAESANLDSAKLLATRMALPRTFSYTLRRRALSSMEKIAPDPGDAKTFRRLEERLLAILADSPFAGLRTDEDWWMYIRKAGFLGLPGAPVYRVYLRSSMPLALLRQQLAVLLDGFESGLSAAEEESGLPALIREAVLGEFGSP
jgi:hypothetical protein